MDGWYPVLVDKDSSGGDLPGKHLVYVGHEEGGNQRLMLVYSEISADPTIPPTREIIDYFPSTSTVTSDSAGKPHIFYLDAKLSKLKHAWLA